MLKSHADNGWASDSPTPAQIKEFFNQVQSGQINKDKLQTFLRGGKGIGTTEEQKEDWVKFYRYYFGMDLELSEIVFPNRKPFFDRLIVVAKELTPNLVYGVCEKNFQCWRYTENLDRIIFHNDRSPYQAYAIWVRDRVEADEELKNLSACQIRDMNISSITLLEYLVYQLRYWHETQKHLDADNYTICMGSCDANKNIFCGRWVGKSSIFKIDLRSYETRADNLRARQVIC